MEFRLLLIWLAIALLIVSFCLHVALKTDLPSGVSWAAEKSKWPHARLKLYLRSVMESHILLKQGYDEVRMR